MLKPFSFTFEGAHPRVRRVAPRVAPMLERLLGLDALNRMYARITSPGDDRSFFERALADLGVGYRVAADDLRRIPKSGPLVVVANHPFGALDGMVLSALLAGVRGDVKVMANYLLSRMPEMREHTFFVDPFGGEGKAAANAGAMRAALRWVRAGNVLAVFPAGEVAHLDLHGGFLAVSRYEKSTSLWPRPTNPNPSYHV